MLLYFGSLGRQYRCNLFSVTSKDRKIYIIDSLLSIAGIKTFNIQTKAKAFPALGMKCLLYHRIKATETSLDKCVLNTRHKTSIVVEHCFGWQYKYLSLNLVVKSPQRNNMFPEYPMNITETTS